MKYLLLFITSFFIQVTTFDLLKAPVVHEDDKKNSQNTDMYLPKNIIPLSYSINLKPHFDSGTFIGINNMKLDVKIATKQIVFHSGQNINLILADTIMNSQKGVMLITSRVYYELAEKYVIFVNDTMPAKSVTELTLKFNGTFSPNIQGMYTTNYWKYSNLFMNNETMLHLFGTHFKPTYARNVFPCFDEPHFKASFTLIIERLKSFLSFCNLSFVTSVSNNETVSDIYETSIGISTYQISFFILDFTCFHDHENTIEICTRLSNNTDLLFALKVSGKARRFFSDFFNENKPLPLVTMIAIPEENPKVIPSSKLLTFSEHVLFYNSISIPDTNYNKLITTIMYGWASMWFGHKITLRKWDYAWINEGIATYLSYFAAHQTLLDVNSIQQIIIDHIHPALLEDGTRLSKPLTRQIRTSKETELIEDTIVVSKGCSIIRMIHSILGTTVFKSALVNFITSRKNKITTLSDFWFSLQKSVNKSQHELPVNLKTIMNSWTNQPGYPVLHVQVKKNKIELLQQKFSYSQSPPASNNTVWWIPLTWVSSRNPNFEDNVNFHWFNKKKDEINVNINQSDWVIFNIQRKGFYRVNYDLETWSRIIDELHYHEETIPLETRAMIIDDLFNLARAGIIPYALTLDGVSYITQEMEYLPIQTALTGFQYLYERFADNEYSIFFNNFLLHLILPLDENINDIDPSNNSSSLGILRAEIDEWLCKLGYKKCHSSMLNYFFKWKVDLNYVIPKNKKSLVYCIAIKNGFLEKVIAAYFDADNLIEKNIVMKSFRCISDKKLLTNLLESAINDEKLFFVNKQQTLSMFKLIAQSSNDNAGFILEFIALNTVKMLKHFQDQMIIADIIHTASKVLSTTDNVCKLRTFIETNYTYFEKISDYLGDILDYVMHNIIFYKQHYQNIVNWIDEQKYILWTPISSYSKTSFFKLKRTLQLARDSRIHLIESLKSTQNLFQFNYYSAQEALNFIEYFDKKFSGRYVSELFRYHISKLIMPIYDELTFEEKSTESLDDRLLRFEIIKWACLLGNADCKKRSRELFDNWKANSSATLPVHLRKSILCTVVKDDNNDDWEFLWNEFKNFKFNIKQDEILPILECVPNRQKLEAFLRFAITYDISRENSLKIFLLISSSGPNGTETILDFMIKNHVDVCDYFPSDTMIDNIFKDILNRVTTRKLLQKYYKCIDLYFKSYPRIFSSLVNYSRTATTDLLKFDVMSLEVFKWICQTYSGNVPLPKNIAPTRYDISLIVPLDAAISHFTGSVNITLNISSDTSYIALHVGHLKLFSVQIYFKNTLTILPIHERLYQYNQIYIIALNETVEAGTQLLASIEYNGIFNNYPNMFYRSYYIGPDKSKHLFAATQVEKYGARHLLPCFDEIYFRADVQLSIRRPSSHFSFTNLILNLSENCFDKLNTWDHYKISEQTSINQISIIITDIDFKNHSVGLKVWLRSHFLSNENNYFTNTSQIGPKDDAGWIILDSRQTGFYYVNFKLITWKNLFENLKTDNFGSISVDDRLQIIDDLYNLAKQNYMSLSSFLTGSEYLINEKCALPWGLFLKCFVNLWNTIDDPEINNGLTNYLSQLMKPTYQYVGFESKKNDTRQMKNLRGLILPYVVFLNYTDFTDNAITVFNQWRKDTNDYPLTNILYPYENICTALLNLGFDEWKFVWQYVATTKRNMDKIILLHALACTQDETALNIYLSHIFSPDNWMNIAMKKMALSAINNNMRNGFNITLDFLIKNYSKNYLSWSTFSSLMYQMTKYPLTVSQLSRFMAFVNNNIANIKNLDSDFYKVLMDNTESAKWYERSAVHLKSWLRDNNFITNISTSTQTSTNQRQLKRNVGR